MRLSIQIVSISQLSSPNGLADFQLLRLTGMDAINLARGCRETTIPNRKLESLSRFYEGNREPMPFIIL
jgi:hypothetical protein